MLLCCAPCRLWIPTRKRPSSPGIGSKSSRGLWQMTPPCLSACVISTLAIETFFLQLTVSFCWERGECHASMSHVFSFMLIPGEVSTDDANWSPCMLNRACVCVSVQHVCRVCSMCVAFVHVWSWVKFMFLGLSVKIDVRSSKTLSNYCIVVANKVVTIAFFIPLGSIQLSCNYVCFDDNWACRHLVSSLTLNIVVFPEAPFL